MERRRKSEFNYELRITGFKLKLNAIIVGTGRDLSEKNQKNNHGP